MITQIESMVIAAAAPDRESTRRLYSRMRSEMAVDLSAELTIRELAARADVAESTVARTLQAHQTTASQLLRELRFDRLATLLREGEGTEPLAELAEQAGYGGADQAGRAFRDRTGVTMSAYRRLVRL